MLDTIRIEAGIPVYGRDMTEETIPVEANLEDALSYTKGCYIGQEVIARIEARGHVNRKLAGLLLSGERLPEPGAKIVSPQREVGWITSAAYSPARQQNIALGYVRREVLTPGTSLEVQGTHPGQHPQRYRGRVAFLQKLAPYPLGRGELHVTLRASRLEKVRRLREGI
jgi:folate-binding protein YgfZ